MSQLISVAEAKNRLLAKFAPVDGEMAPLAQAAGRVLSTPVINRMDLPPFSNSSMDGFALRAADISKASAAAPIHLAVVGDIPAGTSPDLVVGIGQAARIMTGAPLPAGADAVIPVEDTDFQDRRAGASLPDQVAIQRAVDPGAFVRPRGEDLAAGEQVFEPGHVLRPQDIGFLAMLGMAEVRVYRRPRVAIFSTGDELVPVEQMLGPGQIHDSNAYTLAALVERYGGEALHLGIVPDQAEAVERALDRAVEAQADVILSSAGVSVGAYDYVRNVVEQRGQLDFWRVNMRPGKPLAFGSYGEIPFIGLPGNPVSSFVGFMIFVRPALEKLAGRAVLDPVWRRATLAEPSETDGRESYLRGNVQLVNGRLMAYLAGHQGSGNLHSLVLANALLFIPSGVKFLPIGSEIEAWILDDMSVENG